MHIVDHKKTFSNDHNVIVLSIKSHCFIKKICLVVSRLMKIIHGRIYVFIVFCLVHFFLVEIFDIFLIFLFFVVEIFYLLLIFEIFDFFDDDDDDDDNDNNDDDDDDDDDNHHNDNDNSL